MKFLLYSSTKSETIESNLGGIDYSYYFVLQSYLPLLEQLGDVVILDEPITATSKPEYKPTTDTYYFAFEPPNKVDVATDFTTIPVFAWEYSTLPNEVINCQSDDWTWVLGSAGQAITHSQYVVDMAKAELGDNFPIISVPAPIWDQYADLRERREQSLSRFEDMSLNCSFLDSADFEVVDGQLHPKLDIVKNPRNISGELWDGKPLAFSQSADANSPAHLGFRQRESWGAWSNSDRPWLILPQFLHGKFVLNIEILGSEAAVDSLLEIHLGCSYAVIKLASEPTVHSLEFDLNGASNLLSFYQPGYEHTELSGVGLLGFTVAEAVDAGSEPYSPMLDKSVEWYGFHPPEAWGIWSAEENCGLRLAHSVTGIVNVSFRIINTLLDPGELMIVRLGDEVQEVLLTEAGQFIDLAFHIDYITDVLDFIGLKVIDSSDAEEERSLGIGIADLCISEFPKYQDSDSMNLLGRSDVVFDGFHAPEDWGRWTAEKDCKITLPFIMRGKVALKFSVAGYPHQDYGPITVLMGGKEVSVELSAEPDSLEFELHNVKSTNEIRITGLEPAQIAENDDPREIALAITSIEVRGLPPTHSPDSEQASSPGNPIVYTSVLNPTDRRKNWLDLINAFVFALRDKDDAVLMIKITHHSIQPLMNDLCSVLTDLAPFTCRIIFLHGYLNDNAYEQMIAATSYVVNASRGEGQCLPLMEFMSSGVPAIAPDHTAMADYVDSRNAFIVKSSEEPTFWSHDPRMLYRTTRYRIDWESLYLAFSRSFEIAATHDPQYEEMSKHAIASLKIYCSVESLKSRLQLYLQALNSRPED